MSLIDILQMKGARSPLKRVQWLRIVLDEGHAIKNPNSQQTKAICELQAVRKWVLTGNNDIVNEPHREKTGFLPMRKQRRRSASQ